MKKPKDKLAGHPMVVGPLPAFMWGPDRYMLWLARTAADKAAMAKAAKSQGGGAALPLFMDGRPIGGPSTLEMFMRSPLRRKHLYGGLMFRVTDKALIVSHMVIEPRMRRRGLNRQMVEAIQKEFPGREVLFYDLTDQGEAFRKAFGGGVSKTNPDDDDDDDPFDDPDEPLETSRGTYDTVDGAERVVCGEGGANLDKTGMPAYPMGDIDPELDGLFGVHCGSADEWLPILGRDGYCSGDAYVYELNLDEALEDGVVFRSAPDPHVVDKTDTPDSYIVFSKLKKIPAKYVKLVRVVPEAEVQRLVDAIEGSDEDEGGW